MLVDEAYYTGTGLGSSYCWIGAWAGKHGKAMNGHLVCPRIRMMKFNTSWHDKRKAVQMNCCKSAESNDNSLNDSYRRRELQRKVTWKNGRPAACGNKWRKNPISAFNSWINTSHYWKRSSHHRRLSKNSDQIRGPTPVQCRVFSALEVSGNLLLRPLDFHANWQSRLARN